MSSSPENTDDRSFQEGFQAGWKAAAEAVMGNRDHFRKLLDLPAETIEQSMRRIRDERHRPSAATRTLTEIIADGIDLYVVLPREKDFGVLVLPKAPPRPAKGERR